MNKAEDRRELAEKVAGYLYGLRQSKEVGVWLDENGDTWINKELEARFYSWEVIGRMIEYLQEKGWSLEIVKGVICFHGKHGPYTKTQGSDQLGYHEAIARAFVEACEIIEGRNE